MRITVLGLGYVGAVVAACLARRGHQVVGVDTDPGKVALVNSGRAPIIEPEIGEITACEVAAGRLSATADVAAAVPHSDLIMICVGTPSRGNGGIDLSHVQRVCQQIGAALPAHAGAPVIVVRSTVLPGTARDLVIPTLEASSGRQAGDRFRRVRQSGVPARGERASKDFLQAAEDPRRRAQPGERRSASRALYTEIAAPLIRTDIRDAEMVEVRGQHLARIEGRLRERDRQPLQGPRRRQPRGDGHLLPRREAQPLALLPEARLRVRRLVPAEGRARAAATAPGSSTSRPDPVGDTAEQRAADRARRRRR